MTFVIIHITCPTDHHCPWLAYKCIVRRSVSHGVNAYVPLASTQGHWTYTAFLHFLLSVSLLALYVMILCSQIVYFAFVNPFIVVSTARFLDSSDYNSY